MLLTQNRLPFDFQNRLPIIHFTHMHAVQWKYRHSRKHVCNITQCADARATQPTPTLRTYSVSVFNYAAFLYYQIETFTPKINVKYRSVKTRSNSKNKLTLDSFITKELKKSSVHTQIFLYTRALIPTNFQKLTHT